MTATRASLEATFPGLDDHAAFLRWLLAAIAEEVGETGEIDADAAFVDIGLDSVNGVQLAGALEQALGADLPATLAWEHPTPRSLAAHLCSPRGGAPIVGRVERGRPVAIVGMSCRFPAATGLPSYWRMLRVGDHGIAGPPADRAEAWGAENSSAAFRGGYLDDVFGFDSLFFRISPREATAMDPQQRLLLELAWEALDDARIDAAGIAGSDVGVFVGISSGDWAARTFSTGDPVREAYTATGASHSVAANRISYALDARGPSMAIDTACSSSLVALLTACEALDRGDATMAIAGGVNVILSPALQQNFVSAGVMSASGRCRPFDHRADGYVRSEGAGLVVLKPYDEAVQDGDRIYATVRGGAVNNDGRTNGLMAPSRSAQAALLARAYRRAGVDPAGVTYVEGHGSGTRIGDAIEASALADVVGQADGRRAPCRLGSVKSNIGHLEAAAGVAGVIKTALMLSQEQLVPTLEVDRACDDVDWPSSGLTLQQELEDWPSLEPALAGVSSFGFGGTNAHVVLEGTRGGRGGDDAV